MKQPTKEQLNDPKWWDMNAPEGATHFAPAEYGRDATWRKQFLGQWLTWQWVIEQWGPTEIERTVVDRPMEPPEPTKWRGMQDGLPPVGTECEVFWVGEWRETKIVGTDNGVPVFKTDWIERYAYGCGTDARFRPIQSERDKGIDEAMSHIRQDWYAEPSVSISEFVTNAVAQIYDAGYRKPMSRAEANDVLMNRPFYVPAPERRALLDKLGFKE